MNDVSCAFGATYYWLCFVSSPLFRNGDARTSFVCATPYTYRIKCIIFVFLSRFGSGEIHTHFIYSSVRPPPPYSSYWVSPFGLLCDKIEAMCRARSVLKISTKFGGSPEPGTSKICTNVFFVVPELFVPSGFRPTPWCNT